MFLQSLRLELSFKEHVGKYGEGEIGVKEVIEKVMKDRVKADKSVLPHICSLDWEFNLSSIFVEVETPLVRLQFIEPHINQLIMEWNL